MDISRNFEYSMLQFLPQAQYNYAVNQVKDIRRLQDLNKKRPQYQIPDTLPDNCTIQIAHLDLEARPAFRNGQWSKPNDKFPMKKRVFKNINLNDEYQKAMLDTYYSVVKDRALPLQYQGRHLVNKSKSILIRPNPKNKDQGTIYLEYEFSLRVHSYWEGGMFNTKPEDTLTRTSVRISFPVQAFK
jgi:hypothetical protein